MKTCAVGKSKKPTAKTTTTGKKLQDEEDAWNHYTPPLSNKQFSEIKDLAIEGKNSVQILAELDLPAHEFQEVNFVLQSRNFENYRSLSRKAALG